MKCRLNTLVSLCLAFECLQCCGSGHAEIWWMAGLGQLQSLANDRSGGAK